MLTQENSKPLVKSTQVWVNVGLAAATAALSAALPQFKGFIEAHPQLALNAGLLFNSLWRIFITKQPIDRVF